MSGYTKGPERDDAGSSAPGVVRVFGQMLLLPFTVFVYGMELLMRTVRGMQQTVDQGMEVLVGESVPPATDFPSSESSRGNRTVSEDAPPPDTAAGRWSALKSETKTSVGGGAIQGAAEAIHKEIHTMRDKDLSDDQLKLVRYKILFVKRDYEVAFPEREELVHDNITGEAFTAWKIAEFIQRLPKEDIPERWKKKGYPKRRDGEKVPDEKFIHRLDEDDKKFLRVYYEVLERYVREEDDTEVDVLKDIRKAIERLPRIEGGSSTSASAPAAGGGGGTAETSGSAGGGRGYGD